jgi:hypothetical protein
MRAVEKNLGSERLIPVQQYFEERFPGYELASSRHPGGDWSLTIHRNKELHRLLLSAEFLADYTPTQIHESLRRWDVAVAIRSAQCRLIITRAGVKSA